MHLKSGNPNISIIAIIAVMAILLQPFSAVVAMETMSSHADMQQLMGADDHCADHADDADNALSHEIDQKTGTAPDCLDECEVCASTAGAFLTPLLTALKHSAPLKFDRHAFDRRESRNPDLLYRPPILT